MNRKHFLGGANALFLVFALGLLISPTPGRLGLADEPKPIDFRTQIRPLLSDKCFHCHGPDEKTREADLRLDLEQTAIGQAGRSGPFVPKDLESSIGWQRIMSEDPDLQMPPPDAGRSLTDSQKHLIRQWIEQGSPWQDHWSFIPPVRPRIATTSHPDSAIDALVDQKLTEIQLPANPQADPRTLIRRLYLDLIGLPPSRSEVESFLLADEATRVEQTAQRLLASPQYGEKWGRQWLDAARYADSDGFEKDKPRSVWFYRDWVVRAFNQDLPYDQFVIHQIAGDLIPNATADSRVATGFLRNSMINEEGGVDPEQFRMEAMFDRMDAIGKSIMGLAVNCSQCHDHKYDPLSQRDYYGMFSMLNNAHEASTTVYDAQEELQRQKVLADIHRIQQDLQHRFPNWKEELQQWMQSIRSDQPTWNPIRLDWNFDSLGGCKLLLQEDGSYLAQSYAPTKSEFWGQVVLPAGQVSGIRLELLTDPNLPRTGPGRSIYGTGALSEIKVFAAPNGSLDKKSSVKISQATADINPASEPLPSVYSDKSDTKRLVGPVEYAIDGKPETAWSCDAGPVQTHQARKAVFVFEQPIDYPEGTTLWIHLQQYHGGWNSDDNQNCNLGRFRISTTSADSPRADPIPASVRQIVDREPSSWNEKDLHQVFSFWRTLKADWKAENDRIAELWKTHPWGTSQLVLVEREKQRPTAMLERGDQFKPKQLVSASVPAFLHPLQYDGPTPNRLDFARWLVDRKSPLAARAIVNRIWQSYFGIGLVSTSEDLGAQGDVPTYPELLDGLATEFMDSNWSMKKLHLLIVTSKVYQRSSSLRPDHRERDPSNRFLSRGPRVRLDGESLRDTWMQVSGVLQSRVGGAPCYPPAPDFLFQPPVSYGPKTWMESKGDDRFRRSLYVFRFRSVPYPPLQVFDTPNGDSSCVRRSLSNSPLQALTALNESFFVECAQALARRTLLEPQNDSGRLAWLFEEVLGRPAKPEEQSMLRELVEDCSESIHDESTAKQIAGWDLESLRAIPTRDKMGVELPWKDLATWTLVSRVLLNLDETITKE